MTLYSLFIIALALSLDAFGVALCIGLNPQVKVHNKVKYVLSFAFFQFLFSYIGAFGGFLFSTYIAGIPKIIGGIIISLVGVLMLKEGFENKGECPVLKTKMYFVLGISVSIDAAVIGFTALNNIVKFTLLKDTLVIGLVTLIMCGFAFVISKYLKKIEIIGKYADYIGGVILILFGIKMMFF